MASEVRQLIQTAVKAKPVVMFVKSTCGYCLRAKRLFDNLGVPYDSHVLNERPDGAAIQRELHALTGMSTVPSIWIGGQFVGGYSDTKAELDDGKLIPRLKEAKVEIAAIDKQAKL